MSPRTSLLIATELACDGGGLAAFSGDSILILHVERKPSHFLPRRCTEVEGQDSEIIQRDIGESEALKSWKDY